MQQEGVKLLSSAEVGGRKQKNANIISRYSFKRRQA